MVVSPLDDRYSTEMNAVFDDENKLKSWLKVEVALAQAHAEMGAVPKKAAQDIEKAASKVTLARVKQIEAEIDHDLMAAVKALSEQCPGDAGGFVHLGATSYDIEDTATALQFVQAMQTIEKEVALLRGVVLKLAKQHKKTVCVARTHGQHAVPTTYGLKFAVWVHEFDRHLQRLEWARRRVAVGKMSGAAGTMATFGENAFELQEKVMKKLGLEAAPATTQVIQRDRHAECLFVLSLVAATIEKMAKEVRNLQRTEIMEVAEPFRAKQVGSSTMPQKRNPHKTERLCSLSRVVRANVQTALENISLEHERDLTNSANERFIFPESFITTHYMLKQAQKVFGGLDFFPENIEKNLGLTGGQVLAERVMIALTSKGVGRQEAHELLRECSIQARKEKSSLLEVLSKNKLVSSKLARNDLETLLDPKTYIGKAVEIVEKLG